MSKEAELLKNAIFIPGNVASSKNSKQIGFTYLKAGQKGVFYIQKNGRMVAIRPSLQHSKATSEYIKNTKIHYAINKKHFLKLTDGLSAPYRVAFKFIRGTKHEFDYINAAQIVQDLMVDNGWVIDDSMLYVRPYFMEYGYDKVNPGVYICVF
jgi:hypothetical protein